MKTEQLLLENVIGIFSRINYTGVFEASSTKPSRLRSPTKSFSKNIKHTKFKSRYPNPNKEKPILSTLYPDGESAVQVMREIVDYVTALAIIIFISDGEIADKEGGLLKTFYSQAKTELNKFPDEDFIGWAQEKVSDTQNFMKLAAHLDLKNDSCISHAILGYIKNIIMIFISVDGKVEEGEIELGKILLSGAEDFFKANGLESVSNIFDFPLGLIKEFNNVSENNEIINKGDSESEECIEDLINELNNLSGLEGVKAEVATLVNLTKVRSLRQSRGLKMPEVSLHMVFSGRPGTGKTTVGRLLGRIYKSLGVLPKGHLVEVDRSALVAGYVGQTAIKCKEALEKAHGGILFIDEAYTLSRSSGNDYGQEAIDTILKYMEDNRDEIVVIAAGYEEEMDQFVRSNPGLQSRFNKFLLFKDYSIDELYTIFLQLVESHQFYYNEELASKIYYLLEDLRVEKGDMFANARDVRNAFESIVQEQANRIATDGEGDNAYALNEFTDSDVESAFSFLMR